MEELLERMKSGKKPAKQEKAKSKKQKVDADLNKDGKVDEEDLSLARKAVEAAKKIKKIVKK